MKVVLGVFLFILLGNIVNAQVKYDNWPTFESND